MNKNREKKEKYIITITNNLPTSLRARKQCVEGKEGFDGEGGLW